MVAVVVFVIVFVVRIALAVDGWISAPVVVLVVTLCWQEAAEKKRATSLLQAFLSQQFFGRAKLAVARAG